MSRPRKIENLLFDTADDLSIRAATLRNACSGRPEAEARDLMAIASALSRLHARVEERARHHWENEKKSEVLNLNPRGV